jgi:hypothetical protein
MQTYKDEIRQKRLDELSNAIEEAKLHLELLETQKAFLTPVVATINERIELERKNKDIEVSDNANETKEKL